MSKILVLKSSIMGEQSYSNRLLDAFSKQWNQTHKGYEVSELDLNNLQLPALDREIFTGLRNATAQLSPRQKEVIKLSDQLIAQLCAVDLVIIGAPMYNFNIPTSLKNYFDLIGRAGITFRYFENGVKGLIKNVKAIIVTTRGGQHYQQPTEALLPLLQAMLDLLGIPVIDQIIVEGLQLSEAHAENAIQQGQMQLNGWIEKASPVGITIN